MTDQQNLAFHDSALQKVLFTWWAGLEEHHRGDRPALRRCRTPDEVLLTEAYHRARNLLAAAGFDPGSCDLELATAIGLLAHVRTHQPAPKGARSLAAQMAGGDNKSDSAPVSGLRFRRLLQVESRDKLYDRLMGVIRLLDQAVDVNRLAADAFYWRPDTSNHVRRNWANDYYARAPQES